MICSNPSFPGIFLSRNYSALQHPVFSRNLSIQELLCYASYRLFQESFSPGTALLCSIPYFPGIFLFRNLSALQHPVFSRNLSIQELLCSTASRLFQESILYRNCYALQHSVFSRNISIQELLYSAASSLFQDLFYPRNALLFSNPSFSGIYSI